MNIFRQALFFQTRTQRDVPDTHRHRHHEGWKVHVKIITVIGSWTLRHLKSLSFSCELASFFDLFLSTNLSCQHLTADDAIRHTRHFCQVGNCALTEKYVIHCIPTSKYKVYSLGRDRHPSFRLRPSINQQRGFLRTKTPFYWSLCEPLSSVKWNVTIADSPFRLTFPRTDRKRYLNYCRIIESLSWPYSHVSNTLLPTYLIWSTQADPMTIWTSLTRPVLNSWTLLYSFFH